MEVVEGRFTVANTQVYRETLVLLDGKAMEDVVECDTGEGWLKKYKLDDDGKHVFDGNKDALVFETLRGEIIVVIEKK